MHSNAKFCVEFKAIGLICANSRKKPLQIILGVRSGSYFDIFTNENWIFFLKIDFTKFFISGKSREIDFPRTYFGIVAHCVLPKNPIRSITCEVDLLLILDALCPESCGNYFLTCFSSAMTQRISFFSFLISKIITYYFGKIENALSLYHFH